MFIYNSNSLKLMLLPSNILTLPIKHIEIAQQLEEELKQYENYCKAVHFHIMSIYAKTLKAIKQEKDNSLQLAFYFNKFIDGINQSKSDHIAQQRIRRVINIMKNNLEVKKWRKNRRQTIAKIIENNKMQKIFKQWIQVIHLQKSSKFLNKVRLTDSLKEVILLLKQNKERSAINRLSNETQQIASNSIHASILKLKVFKCLLINLKMYKVQHMMKNNYFMKIIKAIKNFNRSSKHYHQCRNKKLLNLCFQSMKQVYHQSLADKFRKIYHLNLYFSIWKNSLQYLASQREYEKSNECITSIFKERKCRAVLFKILCAWRQQVRQSKEMRYHNSIVNRFADLKYKELLLRRHFEILKINRINSQIKSNFYQMKLKRKVIDSLKIVICKSLEKEEKIIRFIEKIEKKKYFDRIKQFNGDQKEKVRNFRLHTIFKTFTFTIVYDYFQKKNRANAYYEHNLLFKGLFSLKKEASFTKNAQFCIIYLNVIRPLRRWSLNYRLSRYHVQKQWVTKKKLFIEWKLLVIKRDSEKKLIRQFKLQDSIRPLQHDQSKMQAFQFDNIMATIAKIRKNFMVQKRETLKNESMRWPYIQTPSQEIDFSISQQNLYQNDLH